jgi:hypothetical protein
MADSTFLRDQADRFDRVADHCAVPELVSYYRTLAEDYRRRAAHPSADPLPQGKPTAIEPDDGA